MGKYSSRYKPVGWQGESQRHYLAAKGIKTKKYFAVQDFLKGNRPQSPTGSSGLLHAFYQEGYSDDEILARRNDPAFAGAAKDVMRKRASRAPGRKYEVPEAEEFSQFSQSSLSSVPVSEPLPTPPIPEEMSRAPVMEIEEQEESSSGIGVANPIVTPGVPPAPIEGARLLE